MEQTVRAPDFDAGLGWLNTDRPLQLGGELHGQVVVLDFWTYCCINCMHILPDLAYLEHKYRSEAVTFIGVHSAKFANESSRETIRAAILRYEIKHPVVIDDHMKIWRAYAVRSWPTLVVIDPKGYVVGAAAGEGNRDVIDQTIAKTLELARTAGSLADKPLTLKREANVRATSGLAFPGKILADDETERLYIADSNHNRIVIAKLPNDQGIAKVIACVGNGDIGQDDGPADQATFNHPQGLAIGQGNLYVADTENHLIRSIDLESLEVTTLVGDGVMSNDRAGGGMGTQQGLNSPWDLTLEGSTMYVAMAGIHQIWRIELPVGFARALAGSGRENIVDGPCETAALAQPSGICLTGGKIYFADSEVSAIRGIDLASEQVFTILGEGLFSFGDVDGQHPKAKIQHPLGIEPWGLSLLVADTYNHKIKLVDPGTRSVKTLLGSGKTGTATADNQVEFFEPGGLSLLDNYLFIADTNNHRVLRINVETKAWREITLEGLDSPKPSDVSDTPAIKVAPMPFAPGKAVELTLDVMLPPQTHLSPEAPWSVRIQSGNETLLQHTGKSDAMPLKVTVPASNVKTGDDWLVTTSFAYCTESESSVCVPTELAWTLPTQDGNESAATLFAKVSA